MTSIVSASRALEGTFSRSMLAAAARGLGLVAAAVAIGVVLLQVTDDGAPPPGAVSATGPQETTTTTTSVPGAGPGTALRPPTQVQVLVLNAARVAGAATEVAEQLQGLGHPTLPPGNAPTQPDTIVYSKPGFEAEAEAIVAELGDVAHAEPLPDPSPFAATEQADVVVVLGTDYAAIR